MYFLWCESMIPSLLVQVSFSYSFLMLGFLKLFLIGPNHVPTNSTHAGQIPLQTVSLRISKSASCYHYVPQHHSDLPEEGSCSKTGTGILSE